MENEYGDVRPKLSRIELELIYEAMDKAGYDQGGGPKRKLMWRFYHLKNGSLRKWIMSFSLFRPPLRSLLILGLNLEDSMSSKKVVFLRILSLVSSSEIGQAAIRGSWCN